MGNEIINVNCCKAVNSIHRNSQQFNEIDPSYTDQIDILQNPPRGFPRYKNSKYSGLAHFLKKNNMKF